MSYRLESSTTQVNAAWEYLLSKGKSFSKPVNEINAFNLRKITFRPLPKPTPLIRAKNTLKTIPLKNRVMQRLSEIFPSF
jgi:hypothetical protein